MTKHASRKVMNFRHLLGCDTIVSILHKKCPTSLLILCFLFAQTKSRMSFFSSLRIVGGIEKISVLYHSLERTKTFTRCTLPMTDKLLALQNCNLFLTFDICFLNISSDVSVFPTQRPRAITLSLVYLQSKGLSCRFLHFPIKSPSVFSMFILAPVAFSYFSSSLKVSFTEPSFATKICVSSAYCKIFCSISRIVIPFVLI